jgi:hypothetical protein
MSNDIEGLKRNFTAASNELKKCVGNKPGMNAEMKYGQAYMALVKAGVAPKLKKKYRGGLK